MGRVLTALPLLLASMMSPAEAEFDAPVDLELVLAVDVSRSINAAEARLQRDGYGRAFRNPDVIRAIGSGVLGRIAVSYIEWSGPGSVDLVAGWTLIDGPASARAFADALGRSLPSSARYTSISGAIGFALPLFEDNGFEGTRRVIDISGDGPNNQGGLVSAARDRAVGTGVTINGLPILDQGGGPYSRFNIPNLDLYYRDCVIGGPGAFLVVAEDFKDFARAVRRKLILEIAGRPGKTLHLAQASARASPPCDIGERILRDFDDF